MYISRKRKFLCWLGFHTLDACWCRYCCKNQDNGLLQKMTRLYYRVKYNCLFARTVYLLTRNWHHKRLICRIGFHKWHYCKCVYCKTNKYKHHKWNGCICEMCNARKATKESGHSWNGCTCVQCHTIRAQNHDWDKCTCRICETQVHTLDDNGKCRCMTCGIPMHDFPEWSDFDQIVDGRTLPIKTAEGIYQYENLWNLDLCKRCGQYFETKLGKGTKIWLERYK